MLYLLEPEVAGELGENTVINNFNSVRLKGEQPEIKHLHYHITGWLEDDILECTPGFIISEKLATDIKKSNINGYIIDDVDISASDEFYEMYPNRKLPKFYRLIPTGIIEVMNNNYFNWSGEDMCLTGKSYLVVTESALNILKKHSLNNCDISPLREA